MKIKSIIFLLLFISQLSYSATLLYRVQLGTFKKGDAPALVSKTHSISTFPLPEGYSAYFSGGYFENYLGSKIRHRSMIDIGFENSVIRVFRNGKLLSILEGQKYIAKEEIKLQQGEIEENSIYNQIYSIDKRSTLQNRLILFDEVGFESPSDSLIIAERKKNMEEENQPFYKNITMPNVGSWFSSDDKSEEKDEPIKEVIQEEVEEDIEGKVVEKEVQPVRKERKKDETIVKEDDVKVEETKPNPKDEKKIIEEKEVIKKEEIAEKVEPVEEVIEVAKEEEKQQVLAVNNEEVIEEDIEPVKIEEVEKTPEKIEQEKAHNEVVEELIKNEEEILEKEDKFSVNDLPVYKIYLASTLVNGKTPILIETLPEIVYTYEKPKIKVFTVGFFGTSNEANKALQDYKKFGFEKAKVVAVFRGMLISQDAADFIVSSALGK